MIIVTLIIPKVMMVLSVTVCLVATLLISFEGGETANYLFAGAALYGFAISWHYGAGVSWTAEHMDVVVRKGKFLSRLFAKTYYFVKHEKMKCARKLDKSNFLQQAQNDRSEQCMFSTLKKHKRKNHLLSLLPI